VVILEDFLVLNACDGVPLMVYYGKKEEVRLRRGGVEWRE
jgi:hypothetical protein